MQGLLNTHFAVLIFLDKREHGSTILSNCLDHRLAYPATQRKIVPHVTEVK